MTNIVVSSGVTSSNLTISSGDVLIVSSGGKTSAITLSGGRETVLAGGSALRTTVSSGGFSLISGGKATSDVVLSGGTEVVTAGGSASATTVSSGGFESVSGGTALGTRINGGSATIINGGSGSAIQLFSGSLLTVTTGGVAISTSVGSGASAVVISGGTTTASQVRSGGFETISSGGVTSLTSVGRGTELVGSGGTASGTVVSGSGGIEIVAGGSAVGTIVSSGGFEVVSSGGIVRSATVVSGGATDIAGGGTDSASTISSGGFENVSGGTAISVTLDGGGMNVGGSGTAIGTHLINGGFSFVSAGGAVTGTVVIGFPSSETIGTGGFATGTTVESGGFQFVSGGRAVGTIIDNAGTGFVLEGGVTTGLTINSGGIDFVFKLSASDLLGGTESGTVVNSGGAHHVDLGGISFNAVVSGGGTEFVDPSLSGIPAGVASATTVLSGGFQTLSGGDTFDTVVDGGGFQLISSGLATSTTVNAGGFEVLSAPDVATDVVLAAGAAVDFAYAPFVAGASAFVGAGDVLSVTDGGNTLTLQLSGDYTGFTFEVTSGLSQFGGTLVTAACYCEGTLIETENGEAPIEALAIGDLVRTGSGALRPIRWIGRRSYAGPFVSDVVRPVLIRAGAIADGVPRRDLMVSPAHAMLIDRDLIPAAALVNGASIVRVQAVDAVHYIHIELDSHDVILAEGAPSETFVDDGSRGMFQNAAEFQVLYPDAVQVPAQFCAPRLEAGEVLEAVQQRLAKRAGVTLVAEEPGRLLGCLDAASRDLVAGWARNEAIPDRPVLLEVLDNGKIVGTVLANRYREDLERAGIGEGRHGFQFIVPGGLSPLESHVITVQRAIDGAELAGSPKTIDAADRFDADMERAVSRAVEAVAEPAAQERVLSFLLAQADRLLQARAEADVQRPARHRYAQFRRRWGRAVPADEAVPADPGRRALLISERVPEDGEDALFRVVAQLGRDGFQANVVAAESMTGPAAALAALEQAGAAFCGAPFYASVEDVLLRQGDSIDLIHLHGAGIATRYLALARRHAPRARIVYCPDEATEARLVG
jgi:autotransporter passenger strand-loop-strand repeat protein